jgi:thioredoxin 1
MSYGCVHCRALEPMIREVAESLVDRVRILRVNVAVEHDLADFYGIRVTPTLVMFFNGREVGRTEGPPPDPARLSEIVTAPFAGVEATN